MTLHVRPARLDEVAALNELIARSARQLSRGWYAPAQIDAAIAHIFGVDTELIDDGSYFVVEDGAQLAGCGGWSRRATLFGGDQAASRAPGWLDPARDAAKIRAFFVHPDRARQGIGRRLLAHCEAAAGDWGFARFELMATLPGVPLYRALGYQPVEEVDYPVGGLTIPFVRMAKAAG